MSNKQQVGEIIVKALKEIISAKDYSEEEQDILLSKASNLIGLAMKGYASQSSQQDIQKAMKFIEE